MDLTYATKVASKVYNHRYYFFLMSGSRTERKSAYTALDPKGCRVPTTKSRDLGPIRGLEAKKAPKLTIVSIGKRCGFRNTRCVWSTPEFSASKETSHAESILCNKLQWANCCDLCKSAAAPGASPMVLLAIARMWHAFP